MQILLLSTYDAGSHKRWREELVEHTHEHQWTVLSLPPRFFSWRYSGNAFSLSMQHKEVLKKKYDLILATSMTNVIALRGLNPNLSEIPTILYFHENQFSYPIQHEVVNRERFHFCLQSLYASLVSDKLVFNSHYNMESFHSGLRTMLKKMPDFAPMDCLVPLRNKSCVIPVPIHQQWFQKHEATKGPLQIIWNHRWEYDKAPNRFFEALFSLSEKNVPFDVHVVGQSFKRHPPIFDEAKSRLSKHIKTWGFRESVVEYQALLRKSDVVVSTALHEFQGLALLEAVASGCHPLAPNRLAYPEFLDDTSLYFSDVDNETSEIQTLTNRLHSLSNQLDSIRSVTKDNPLHLSWNSLLPNYKSLFDEVAG